MTDFVDTVEVTEEQKKVLEEVKKDMLGLIHDEDLKEKINGVFVDFWDDFVKIPASKGLMYHHKHENIRPGGMINHLLRSLWFAAELIKETGIKDQGEIDEVKCAVMLHDIGVLGRYNKYVALWDVRRLYHGTLGAKILAKRGFPEIICEMVKRHMSHWDEPWAQPKTTRQWIVAYSDYMASRETININGMMVLKEKDGILVYEKVKIKARI